MGTRSRGGYKIPDNHPPSRSELAAMLIGVSENWPPLLPRPPKLLVIANRVRPPKNRKRRHSDRHAHED